LQSLGINRRTEVEGWELDQEMGEGRWEVEDGRRDMGHEDLGRGRKNLHHVTIPRPKVMKKPAT
jgi:hypothetical protein